MTGKQLYEKYKGRKAELYGHEGIVCGYDKSSLIAAVTFAGRNQSISWHKIDFGDKIITHTNNELGYMYVWEKDIVNENKEI